MYKMPIHDSFNVACDKIKSTENIVILNTELLENLVQ